MAMGSAPMAGELATVRTVAALRARVAAWRRDGLRVAVTPTMGALHDGHLSLLRVATEAADRIVATIFVNPTQFGENEDFSSYPRDERADAALLAEHGCDLLFAPSVAEMYPPNFSTEVRVGGLTNVLCGAVRAGHFDGVALVVSKLLIQAQADVAVFGEKDWQQLAVIRRLVRDLDIPTEIVAAPTVRESDGLAMSSRNRYLTPEERAAAPALYRSLRDAAQAIAAGGDVGAVVVESARALAAAGFRKLDYFEARSAETLEPIDAVDPARPARVFAAAHLGKARLIDNAPIAV